MTTKLRPSCADSVTATSGSPVWRSRPFGQKRGETTTAQPACFVNVSLGNKPCALGRGHRDQLVAVTESAQLGRSLVVIYFFSCTSDFLTVQTYTEVQKQTMSF